MIEGRRVGATYRLQVRGIGLDGAARIVPYLARLGIETLYLSPIFVAKPESTHGYDVTDFDAIDEAIGGRPALDRLLGALESEDMNLLVDLVPNHLAATADAPLFAEALMSGKGPAGRFFDVDWDEESGRIVLPFLAGPLAGRRAAGAVWTERRQGRAVLVADGRWYPVAGGAARREDLGALLDRQHYRLVDWRRSEGRPNYRRFFDIDDLIALRQEDKPVYRSTHRLALELAADARVAGLRIDHVDGLSDPAGYLGRLSRDVSRAPSRPRLFVEKILDRRERIPEGWPVAGTTGYEFANLAIGLFINPDGAAAIAAGYRERSGDRRTFDERRRDAKRLVLDALFARELAVTAERVGGALAGRHSGPPQHADVVEAVREIVVELDRYRTYLAAGTPAPGDVVALARAFRRARPRLGAGARTCAAAIVELVGGPLAPSGREALRRLEQLAGATMAKGSEDTALFDPGTSLAGADVGSDPEHPSTSLQAFHAAMRGRLRDGGLSATSTHDSKRSEDVRTRLAVFTEDPEGWLGLLDRWRARHDARRELVADRPVPGPALECYLYETIVGAGGGGEHRRRDFAPRLAEHVLKAARETKRETSWTNPDRAFERALRRYLRAVLGTDDAGLHRDLDRLGRRLGLTWSANAAALALLKVAAPGIPDHYQGSELGRAMLTDPDNRRPVDFDAATRRLARVRHDPLDKLSVLRHSLSLRRADPKLLEGGRYVPLAAAGRHGEHVVAFARRHEGRALICVVARGTGALARRGGASLGDTVLEVPRELSGRYAEVLSDRAVELKEGNAALSSVCQHAPLVLLYRTNRQP